MSRVRAMSNAGLGFVLLTMAAASAQTPILDNTCATAPTVACPSSVPIRFQTPYAEDNERRPNCAGSYAFYNAVWMKFVPTGPLVSIDLCTPSNAVIDDTLLAIYRVTNPGNPCLALAEIACDDDSPYCGDDDASPSITNLSVIPGETLYIQVGALGYSGACSPCTNGDYFVRIQCSPEPPCEFQDPNAPGENELEPCTAAGRLNEGCSSSPPLFAAMRIGESRRGTSFYESEADHDEDWSRFVQPGPDSVAVTLSAQSQFQAVIRLLRAGASECDTTQLMQAVVPACWLRNEIATVMLEPGEYYLVVEVDGCADPLVCQSIHRDYVISLTTQTPTYEPPTGACCLTGGCVQTSESSCNAGAGTYYGDGTSCATTTCYACPLDGLFENEPMTCPANGHVNSYNGGCDFSSVNLPMISVASGQTWCGVTATFFNAALPAGNQNKRDTDWYKLQLTGVPTGQWRRIALNFLAEFPAEVLVYNPDLGSAPCSNLSARLATSVFVRAGEQTQISSCVLKRVGMQFYGDVFIVVRPIAKGTPREIPCGRRYRLTVDVQPCDGAGACCVTTTGGVSQGCQHLTVQACQAAGGVFFGEAVSCDAVCCPCPAGATAENEPNCGDPNDTTNGGCNAPGAGYPFNTTALATPGSTVCGTARYSGSTRDTDWYVYNHPGGDIVYTLAPSDFIPRAFIIKPGAGADPNAQCAGLEILADATGTPCDPLVITAAAQPAGVYWLWAGTTYDPAVACGRSYLATVEAITPAAGGRCCVPADDPNSSLAGCMILSEAACLSAGGVWGGDGSTCDPNPCPGCPVVCGPDAVDEGEPLCNTGPVVNGGCDTIDQYFSNALAGSGAAVCGTTYRPASGPADTDWYDYSHAGGDLAWAVRAEFLGTLRIIGPIYSDPFPCCPAYDSREFAFSASCTTEAGAVPNVPPGRYFIVVGSRAGNGPIACGSKYELRVSSGSADACCVDGGCATLHLATCGALGGIWRGVAASCLSGACFCAGDLDCDGDVDFFDIDPFVAALDPGASPDCPRMNADCDGDGDVDFFDIDPFVVLLGSSCE